MRQLSGRYELGDRERYRQRRRRSKPLAPLPDGEVDDIRREIDEVSDLVPKIGDGLRWYDYPYRLLAWMLWGWPKRLFGRKAREALVGGLNRLSPYNELDRYRAESRTSRRYNVFVPDDEHVTVPSIWVVELFPPTELSSLTTALARNGWDKPPLGRPEDRSNSETLNRSRAQGTEQWWRVVDIGRPGSGFFPVDSIRADLPQGVDLVEIQARQVGASLTAIVARFRLSKAEAATLDAEWHRPHEPRLIHGPGRAQVLNREWAAFRDTQEYRRGQHDRARRWLAKTIPGYFASRGRAQPVLDLMLFDHFDPTISRDDQVDEVSTEGFSDALRSLGMSDHELYLTTSNALPGLVLYQSEPSMHDGLGKAPLWTLWGKRATVLEALGTDGVLGYGRGDKNQAIASRLVSNMFSTLVMLSVSEFIRLARADYAAVRDTASVQHVKFRPRALDHLRSAFLAQSINIATLSQDITRFWERRWIWADSAAFESSWAPTYRQQDEAEGRAIPKSWNFNKRIRKSQEAAFRRLIQEDHDYRDILSTVATLGASADAFRVGRLALWVSLASLLTSLATVTTVGLGPETLVGSAFRMLKEFFDRRQ